MMVRDNSVKFHLEQAERYSRALSDPMYVSEYSARFLAQSITYHRSMADWYMAEPQPPTEEKTDGDAEMPEVWKSTEHERVVSESGGGEA